MERENEDNSDGDGGRKNFVIMMQLPLGLSLNFWRCSA